MSANRPSAFQLHETAAMRLCQLAFVLMGGLPVLASLGWILLECLPAYQHSRAQQWQAALSNKLGVTVSIDSVQPTSPTRVVFEGVTLRHPESRQVICRMQRAKADEVAGQWIIRVEEGEFASEQAVGAWRATHDWLLCRPDELSNKVAIAFDRLHWLKGTGQHTLTDVRLVLLPGATHQILHIQFLPAAPAIEPGRTAEALEPTELMIRREYETLAETSGRSPEGELAEGKPGTYKTAIRLKTGSTALPCGLAADVLSPLRSLGEAATFAGVVDYVSAEDGWALWLNKSPAKDAATRERSAQQLSIFQNLDFERLTWGTGARLQGLGTLALIDEVCITDLGLHNMRGVLDIRSPQAATRRNHIGSRFMREASRFLDIQLATEALSASSRSDYPFDQLRLEFELKPGLLYLKGSPDGSIVTSGQQSLAWRSPERWQQPLRPVNLVAMLKTIEQQDAASGIVMGKEAGWLSRFADQWLPEHDPAQVAARQASGLTDLR